MPLFVRIVQFTFVLVYLAAAGVLLGGGAQNGSAPLVLVGALMLIPWLVSLFGLSRPPGRRFVWMPSVFIHTAHRFVQAPPDEAFGELAQSVGRLQGAWKCTHCTLQVHVFAGPNGEPRWLWSAPPSGFDLSWAVGPHLLFARQTRPDWIGPFEPSEV